MTTALTGTGVMVRLILRRDRLRLPIWLLAIIGLVYVSAGAVQGLYDTPEAQATYARTVGNSGASIAMNGPPVALDTIGGITVFEVSATAIVGTALMAIFLVIRHTRADEEAGRTELLRAAVVGRNAPVTAALVVTAGGLAVTGALITLSMLALGLPAAGSMAYGAAMAAFGVLFAGVTAVAAQVTEHNRPAYGITGTLLGLSFVVRAVGDVGDGTLSWLSPMGWAQSVRPYAGERWWPLALLVAGSVALVGVAYALLSRRDLGGGLVAARPGPPTASGWLGRPWGLAVRLQRATLLAWAAGLVLTGIAYGSLGEDVADLIGDSEEMADIIAQAGGSLTDSYFATSLLMLAIIAGGYTVSSALRARNEETSGRAEPLLGTALARTTWAATHLAVATGGSTLILAATGAAMGGTYGLIVGDADQVPRLTGAALGFAPSLWVLAGVATALFGLVPRAALAASWAVYAWCALVGFLGQLLDLPQWAMDVSPFEHVPEMPAQGVEWLPLVVLTLVAMALTAVGLTGLRRRDAGY
jgi:ABC-2 type transport system permease protein